MPSNLLSFDDWPYGCMIRFPLEFHIAVDLCLPTE